MPRFKVAKTTDKDKLQLKNNSFVEDKLYVYKETNKFGNIYYDFGYEKDENGNEIGPIRIKIGSLDNVYTTSNNLTNDVEVISTNDILKFNSNDSLSTSDINEIHINEFVINNKSIYNIRDINRNDNELTLRKIYTQQDLKWNDYYTV